MSLSGRHEARSTCHKYRFTKVSENQREDALRLAAQVRFVLASDGLKHITRKNLLHSGARCENAAEHSWHLTLLALTFAEHAPPKADIAHVIKLLIIHDLVEVYAGDHWEPESDAEEVANKEQQAAQALFGRLPHDQQTQMHALWEEFEARNTPEARFAKALDALHPMLLVWGPGGTGRTHTQLSAETMLRLKRPYLEAFPALWDYARSLLETAVSAGTLPRI